MPGKKVLEHHSGLRLSEKELLEWRSGASCHKNTPGISKKKYLLPSCLGSGHIFGMLKN
jgi:hypothetical protein